MSAAGRLQIERFHANYLVPAHQATTLLRSRLDDAVRSNLADTLRATLGPWLDGEDESVWLIRELDVEVEVNTAWERGTAARRWAAQVGVALARKIAQADLGDGVLRFANHAAYLSRFLTDLARGDAWGKWYYARFQGLKRLPTSAALRTAVCAEPATGLGALLQTRGGERKHVLDSLTRLDAGRVLDALAAEPGSALGAEDWGLIRMSLDRVDLVSLSRDTEAHVALELYLRACDESAERAGTDLVRGVRAVMRALRRILEASPTHRRVLMQALLGDASRRFARARPEDADRLRILDLAPRDVLQALADFAADTLTVGNSGGVGKELDSSARPAARGTPFGGIFLLLPLLDRVPLEESICGIFQTQAEVDAHGNALGPNTEAEPAVLRLLLLAKCLGNPRAARSIRDPVARELSEVRADIELSGLQYAWGVSRGGDALGQLMAGIAVWRLESGMVGTGDWLLLHVRLPGAPAAVLLDAATGVWLWSQRYTYARPDRLAARLAMWLETVRILPTRLLADAALAGVLRTLDPECTAGELADTAPQSLDGAPQSAGFARYRELLPRDLEYLESPAALGVSRPLDLALSVVAQGVLRQLATRFPGFAMSSLPYLYANFLDFAATLEDEPARRVARLRSPPLALILNASGLARRAYRLHAATDNRPIALFPAE